MNPSNSSSLENPQISLNQMGAAAARIIGQFVGKGPGFYNSIHFSEAGCIQAKGNPCSGSHITVTPTNGQAHNYDLSGNLITATSDTEILRKALLALEQHQSTKTS